MEDIRIKQSILFYLFCYSHFEYYLPFRQKKKIQISLKKHYKRKTKMDTFALLMKQQMVSFYHLFIISFVLCTVLYIIF